MVVAIVEVVMVTPHAFANRQWGKRDCRGVVTQRISCQFQRPLADYHVVQEDELLSGWILDQQKARYRLLWARSGGTARHYSPIDTSNVISMTISTMPRSMGALFRPASRAPSLRQPLIFLTYRTYRAT
jgi:hypothetical protein